ncbi:flavin reductase family protein [Pelistega sp. MC2]|uniref:flavin reductase family protein n=1 Tax=Pelistega sp. MC2 TaxID=1720297 RepID=UPI0008D9AB80|nr:flavin reductase family protein [Pelistega sp. MC2]
MSILSVPLEKCLRLINHGPTVMVSSKHDGIENVMSVAWACALDFLPPKVTIVIDKSTFTRPLIEKSGYFAIQVPMAYQAETVIAMGDSRYQHPDKLTQHNIEFFYPEGFDIPLVKGCAAYLVCKLIPEPHNQQCYDLFIGEIIAAFADDRVFKDGHWLFDQVDNNLKTLHYIAGGKFYITGQGLDIGRGP